MSGVVQSAGAKLYIGTKAANGASDTYTEVAEIESFGEFGKTYQSVKFNPVGNKRTQKLKGSYDEGSLSLTLGRVPDDAGQTALQLAVDDNDAYTTSRSPWTTPPTASAPSRRPSCSRRLCCPTRPTSAAWTRS